MSIKKATGTVLVLVGIALIGAAIYIKGEVSIGRVKIASAQKQVDTGSSLFSLSPYTKDVGKGLTDSAQKKIDEGKKQAGAYDELADRIQIGGIICVILGIGIFFIPSRKGRRR
jgi:hypothetical protein